MHLRRAMFLVLCLCLLSVGAFADSVTGQFTIDVNGNPVPSQGSVTFTLNGDGSISASLTVTNGFNILGFGFNSLTPDLPESNVLAHSARQPVRLVRCLRPPTFWIFLQPVRADGNLDESTVTTRRFSMFWTATASPRSTSSCLTPNGNQWGANRRRRRNYP